MLGNPEASHRLSEEAHHSIVRAIIDAGLKLGQDSRGYTLIQYYNLAHSELPDSLTASMVDVADKAYPGYQGTLHPYANATVIGLTVGARLAQKALGRRDFRHYCGNLQADLTGMADRHSAHTPDLSDTLRFVGSGTITSLSRTLPPNLLTYESSDGDYSDPINGIYQNAFGYSAYFARELLTYRQIRKAQPRDATARFQMQDSLSALKAVEGKSIPVEAYRLLEQRGELVGHVAMRHAEAYDLWYYFSPQLPPVNS